MRESGYVTSILIFCIVALPGPSFSAPSIAAISGFAIHGGSIALIGAGFGDKTRATPAVWDDASGIVNAPDEVLKRWSGAWPDAGTQVYWTQYRSAPYRGVSAPHNRVGQFLAGAHGDDSGANAGYNVLVWKSRGTISTWPAFTYASWWQRVDPAWVNPVGSDGNFKTYDWSVDTGGGPYNMNGSLDNNWYSEYNPRPWAGGSQGTPEWHLNDDGPSLTGTGQWGSIQAAHPGDGWIKIEHYIKFARDGTGFVRIYENGERKLNYVGRTDAMGTAPPYDRRLDAIGGYARDSGQPSNYRYFTDLYLDYTFQHAVLGNAATIDACTKLEVQLPVSWTDSSVSLKVNRGVFSDGEPVYAYIYDAAGVANSSGFPVLSAPQDRNVPARPKGLKSP